MSYYIYNNYNRSLNADVFDALKSMPISSSPVWRSGKETWLACMTDPDYVDVGSNPMSDTF